MNSVQIKTTVPRKVVQVTASNNALYAVAEDGTLWIDRYDGLWKQYYPLPEKEYNLPSPLPPPYSSSSC